MVALLARSGSLAEKEALASVSAGFRGGSSPAAGKLRPSLLPLLRRRFGAARVRQAARSSRSRGDLAGDLVGVGTGQVSAVLTAACWAGWAVSNQ